MFTNMAALSLASVIYNSYKKEVVKFGRNWNNAAKVSAFYWNLNNSASNSNANISSRLCNVLIHFFEFSGLHRASLLGWLVNGQNS